MVDLDGLLTTVQWIAGGALVYAGAKTYELWYDFSRPVVEGRVIRTTHSDGNLTVEVSLGSRSKTVDFAVFSKKFGLPLQYCSGANYHGEQVLLESKLKKGVNFKAAVHNDRGDRLVGHTLLEP